MFRSNFACSLLVCMSFLLLFVRASQAELFGDSSSEGFIKNNNAYFTAGQATGKANELVYCQPAGGCPADYKLSQLVWEIKDVTMLIAGFSSTRDNITLNVEGKFGVTEGNGVMDDYDWQYVGQEWTDWSHHDDTKVSEATVLDVNLDYRFYASSNTNLSMQLGYKHETWAWNSRGGSYIYSDTANSGFRDLSGSFTPGQLVISYKQQFKMPYIGLNYNFNTLNWKFRAHVIYSNQVGVSTIDFHHLRDLTFEDNFGYGEMAAYDVSLTYKLDPGLGIMARYDTQDYKEVRGDTTYTVTSTGASAGSCVDCAGADNSNSIWSLGILYEY